MDMDPERADLPHPSQSTMPEASQEPCFSSMDTSKAAAEATLLSDHTAPDLFTPEKQHKAGSPTNEDEPSPIPRLGEQPRPPTSDRLQVYKPGPIPSFRGRTPPPGSFLFPPGGSGNSYKERFSRPDVLPPANTPFHVQLQAYAQRWGVWAAEVKDEKARDQLIKGIGMNLENVWRAGIEKGLYPVHGELAGQTEHKSQKRKKERRAASPGSEVVLMSLTSKESNRTAILIKELHANGVTKQDIEAKLEEVDFAEGDDLYESVINRLGRKLVLGDWHNKVPKSQANPLGRDLLKYCFYEVQSSKDQIERFERLLVSFNQSNQIKNTRARIAEGQEQLDKYMALAMLLSKTRDIASIVPSENEEEEEEEEVVITRSRRISTRQRPVSQNTIETITSESENGSDGETTQENVPNNHTHSVHILDSPDPDDSGVDMTQSAANPFHESGVAVEPFESYDSGVDMTHPARTAAREPQDAQLENTQVGVSQSIGHSQRTPAMSPGKQNESSNIDQIEHNSNSKRFDQTHIAANLVPNPVPGTPASSTRSMSTPSQSVTVAEHERRLAYLDQVYRPKINNLLREAGWDEIGSEIYKWPIFNQILIDLGFDSAACDEFGRLYNAWKTWQGPQAGSQQFTNTNRSAAPSAQSLDQEVERAKISAAARPKKSLRITLNIPRNLDATLPDEYRSHQLNHCNGFYYRFLSSATLAQRQKIQQFIVKYSLESSGTVSVGKHIIFVDSDSSTHESVAQGFWGPSIPGAEWFYNNTPRPKAWTPTYFQSEVIASTPVNNPVQRAAQTPPVKLRVHTPVPTSTSGSRGRDDTVPSRSVLGKRRTTSSSTSRDARPQKKAAKKRRRRNLDDEDNDDDDDWVPT